MIGIKFTKKKNQLKIYGNPDLNLNGSYVVKDFRKDHRVFMMACIAALAFGGEWKIYDPDSISTSFPLFLKEIKKLGARLN